MSFPDQLRKELFKELGQPEAFDTVNKLNQALNEAAVEFTNKNGLSKFIIPLSEGKIMLINVGGIDDYISAFILDPETRKTILEDGYDEERGKCFGFFDDEESIPKVVEEVKRILGKTE